MKLNLDKACHLQNNVASLFLFKITGPDEI